MSEKSYSEHVRADARLVILRALNEETDGRLNETLLTTILDTYGHRRSREWVRTELRRMEELGALSVHEHASVAVAEILQAGVDHLERRSVIEGIALPSRGS